mmetsp:Transcript_9363/g.10672  ORF Transcript_9363/g.10672 Transcript_9363/m.10672 type:complete len:184 (-) Transcript_9363:287-838(-)|eukprot:CAMPEP_0184020438 /NCGR_PEP_ID=MMETSP0954-20121128/9349_1 /TAXON_ID=627963 /ORGANISM="Aplanochytrium sp, Strain PBS07" /LENGTH=183 /DNA_ID=CAMNT_0026302299 /DNA_START=291 /DNA_END=842 /DNA_ORIENTATION=-
MFTALKKLVANGRIPLKLKGFFPWVPARTSIAAVHTQSEIETPKVLELSKNLVPDNTRKFGLFGRSCTDNDEELRKLRVLVKVGLPSLSAPSFREPLLSHILPSKILGGLSIYAFQALYGWKSLETASLSLSVQASKTDELRELKILNARLFDENEELEDLVRDLTVFVEHQKDIIEKLKLSP